jgi:hypothetical protein
MILSNGEAKMKQCPKNSNPCVGMDCMMWKFWVPKMVDMMEKKPHGIKDRDKKGYCGLSGSY